MRAWGGAVAGGIVYGFPAEDGTDGERVGESGSSCANRASDYLRLRGMLLLDSPRWCRLAQLIKADCVRILSSQL